jgi:5-formaminoimidazole-4-carboxamide-1-beta-D-ribofuranosyl 5'-monophosphate synthetase
MIYPGLSTGGRLAMEIRDANAAGHIKDIMS